MDQESTVTDIKSKSAYWRDHFLGWQSSGLSQEHYCDREQISFASFGYWRTKLLAAKKGSSHDGAIFKRVSPSKASVESEVTGKTPPHSSISVLLPNGVRIMLQIEATCLPLLFDQLGRLSC
jgi:hypothetical protein